MSHCNDLDEWIEVLRAPNGTLTAANVTSVLRAARLTPARVFELTASIEQSRCTTGGTVSCSCPDGGTVSSTESTTVDAGTTTFLQCSVATMCGMHAPAQLVDGSSARRSVSSEDLTPLEYIEVNRYTLRTATGLFDIDVAFFVDATGAPLRGVPVEDGVVAVRHEPQSMTPTMVTDRDGVWNCGRVFPTATGVCQRDSESLAWQLP